MKKIVLTAVVCLLCLTASAQGRMMGGKFTRGCTQDMPCNLKMVETTLNVPDSTVSPESHPNKEVGAQCPCSSSKCSCGGELKYSAKAYKEYTGRKCSICGGTGKNYNGGTCSYCDGEGKDFNWKSGCKCSRCGAGYDFRYDC